MYPLDKEDPKLRHECSSVSPKEMKTREFQDMLEDLLAFVYGHNNKGERSDRDKPMTVGLSANQVGILKKISIVDLAIGKRNYNDIHILINPLVVWHSDTLIENKEGCVNLPEIWGMVERYDEVIVEALDRSGNKITVQARDWPAILLQHEIDHLDGTLFIDHLHDPTKAHFVKENDTAEYRKTYKTWADFIDVSYLVRKRVS